MLARGGVAAAVGTHGKLTAFASYNNVHKDSVQFAFPAACKSHDKRYTGPSVVTNVPPKLNGAPA